LKHICQYLDCNDEIQKKPGSPAKFCAKHLAAYKADYARRYRAENRERLAEQKRQYRQANRETIGEKKRQYNQANRERIAETNRHYREANREIIAEKRHLRRMESRITEKSRQNQLIQTGMKYIEQINREMGMNRITEICRQCGKKLAQKRARQSYCSDDCYRAAFRSYRR